MSVESFMARSARGEYLPVAQSILTSSRQNDTIAVLGIYGGAVIISFAVSGMMIGSGPGAQIAVNIFFWIVWATIAFFFVAIGTRLSHNMATWGIALIAAIIYAINALGAVMGLVTYNTANELLSDTGLEVPGAGQYTVLLFVSGLACVAASILFVQMNRAMRVISSAGRHPQAGSQPFESPQPGLSKTRFAVERFSTRPPDSSGRRR